MKNIFLGLFAASLVVASFAVSPAVQASSLSTAQKQAIVGLMSSFGADAATIARVQESLGDTVYTTPATAASCLSIRNTLKLNSTDATTNGEVSKLQAFLLGLVTGHFGPLTEQLVKNWQSSHGIVSSGTADTTGFGVVGAKTRSAMGCQTSTVQPLREVMFGMPRTTPTSTQTPAPAPTPTPGAASGVNVTAAIDKITSADATTRTTITGHAQGTTGVTLSLSQNGQKIYDSGVLAVVGGTWTVTIPASFILRGTYAINVFDGSSTRVLARGSMMITTTQ